MTEGWLKRVPSTRIIGYTEESNSYFMHSFDSTGHTSLMQAQVEVERWIFVGETIRFTGGFRANDKVFAGVWESRSPDGTLWQPLMDVTLRKVE